MGAKQHRAEAAANTISTVTSNWGLLVVVLVVQAGWVTVALLLEVITIRGGRWPSDRGLPQGFGTGTLVHNAGAGPGMSSGSSRSTSTSSLRVRVGKKCCARVLVLVLIVVAFGPGLGGHCGQGTPGTRAKQLN